MKRIKVLIACVVILFTIAIGLPVGVAILYTNSQVQHECNALELLTATPVPKPSNPAANPSRETTYKFYVALLYWEKSDGCH